jgi:hypothetical protein
VDSALWLWLHQHRFSESRVLVSERINIHHWFAKCRHGHITNTSSISDCWCRLPSLSSHALVAPWWYVWTVRRSDRSQFTDGRDSWRLW